MAGFASAFEPLGTAWPSLIGGSLYLAARIGGYHDTADIAGHVTTSILAASAASGLAKFAFGRARPYLPSSDDGALAPFRALADGGYTSFPSGHTTAAFAMASALSAELSDRWPRLAPIAPTVLYTAASLTGFARVYHDRHWLTDVVAGAMLGRWVGLQVVRHAHAEDAGSSAIEPFVALGPTGGWAAGIRIGRPGGGSTWRASPTPCTAGVRCPLSER
ncbi:MAG: phosphatase PAP2 family protein [Gemmatimonadota bacterium]